MHHAIILNEGMIWETFITIVTIIDGLMLNGLEMTTVIHTAIILNVIQTMGIAVSASPVVVAQRKCIIMQPVIRNAIILTVTLIMVHVEEAGATLHRHVTVA